MKKLFDFQHDLVHNIRKAFRKERRVIGQLATGGGKGVILSDIARLAIEKGNVVCISCHRIEIFKQIFDHLVSFGITPGLIMAGHHPMPGSQCYLSMVETISRRMDRGLIEKLNINFFILDEVHFGAYYKLVEKLDCNVLGFTATPKSTGSPELKDYFGDIVCGPPISELIKIGRLVKPITFSIDHDFSKVKMKGKEFDDKALFKEFTKPKLREGAVKQFLLHAKDRQALCFNVNIEHSHATNLQFRDHGIKSAHVDGKTDAETRSRIFQMYRDGDIQVINNVGIATTGTDLPDTGCIIQNYASTSLVKVKQVTGRGGRCADGKTDFIDIDMGRNYIRHGTFDEDINWGNIFQNPSQAITKRSKKDKRECEECGAVMRAHLRQCPFCGDLITVQSLENKMLDGASVEEIRAYRLKQVPPELRKPVQNMGYDELVKYGRIMGYKPNWPHTVMTYRKK